jgi:ribosomal protein S18 acetylase RimI-like enzyme
MEVRAALPEDCRSIAEVHVASWQAAYAGLLDSGFLATLSVESRVELWRRVLSQRQSEVLACCAHSRLIGFVSFGPSRDADAPLGRGELSALYVHPRAWSTGAGRGLWNAAHAGLLAQGLDSVSLWVLERNERAIAFYSKSGFHTEPGSAKQLDIGGTLLREVRMVHASEPSRRHRVGACDAT